MSVNTIPASGCEISRLDTNVVLMLETAGDDKNIAAVMSPKEARRVASRLGKAANDASAAKARDTSP